jgi:coenzyme F420-0:L-glutamate ligase/coenzyme F420-1:gamma-L-glutamate ligase
MLIVPLTGIGEVSATDQLARILADAISALGLDPGADDVLVVTQKIVSKAEGRRMSVANVRPGAEAQALSAITGKDARLVEIVLGESSAVVRAAPNVLITRHRTGHVMANAGVDRSNLGDAHADEVLLLPVDADASAARLRADLAELRGNSPAIIISDSFGRPWRNGVVPVAIGASGMPALIDRRGERDRDGRPLEITQIAMADMLAAAAGVVMGEADEGIPAALIQGLTLGGAERKAAALVRPPEEDLFK